AEAARQRIGQNHGDRGAGHDGKDEAGEHIGEQHGWIEHGRTSLRCFHPSPARWNNQAATRTPASGAEGRSGVDQTEEQVGAETVREAKCFCGAVTIRVRGAPAHYHGCTCTNCQRATGSVMALNAWFPEAQVMEMSGPMTVWRPGPKGVENAFCSVC